MKACFPIRPFVFVFALLVLCIQQAAAAQGVSNRLSGPGAGDIDPVVSIGYFLPNEGDLQGGFVAGAGLKYTKGKDTFFAEFLHSRTDLELFLNNSGGDADNIIVQAGYMTGFDKWRKLRAGFGLQLHKIDFENISSITKLTGLTLVEYGFRNNWSVRLQSSYGVKKDTIKLGSNMLLVQYRL